MRCPQKKLTKKLKIALTFRLRASKRKTSLKWVTLLVLLLLKKSLKCAKETQRSSLKWRLRMIAKKVSRSSSGEILPHLFPRRSLKKVSALTLTLTLWLHLFRESTSGLWWLAVYLPVQRIRTLLERWKIKFTKTFRRCNSNLLTHWTLTTVLTHTILPGGKALNMCR